MDWDLYLEENTTCVDDTNQNSGQDEVQAKASKDPKRKFQVCSTSNHELQNSEAVNNNADLQIQLPPEIIDNLEVYSQLFYLISLFYFTIFTYPVNITPLLFNITVLLYNIYLSSIYNTACIVVFWVFVRGFILFVCDFTTLLTLYP